LSSAGHIASLVNPPANPKSSYYTGSLEGNPSPDEWLETAEQHTGSWWENWADWVSEKSGDLVEAPTELGSRRYPAETPAPGRYVRESH
jgi:polyhydroxyalkanoate synthase